MAATREQHAAFWRTLAADLKSGRALLPALEDAKTRVGGTDLERAAADMRLDIEGGSALSEAMARHEAVFSHCVRTMVRAGEAGGVLDVIAERIAEGVQDGSFPLPGAARGDDPVAFWRAFGRLLSSGVPILEAVGLLAVDVAGPKLSGGAGAIRQAILDGQDMASALAPMPGLFPEGVRAAVAAGEQKGDLDTAALRIADAIEAGDLGGLAAEAATVQPLESAPVVVKFVNLAIIEAFQQRASDIHVDPTEDGRGRVRLRVDGVLRDVEPPPPGLFPKVVSRIKIMASMDIAERRLPQDGRIEVKVDGKELDLRVSTVPTVLGERVVIRLLDRAAVVLSLERIGLLDDDLAAVQALCRLPNGIVICNGPTGSGKTTLLYAMLNEIDREKCCVMSVEDPVEYRLKGVGQIQTDIRRGLTIPRALRSVLRQDPDVIMVGEIRDLETLETVVQCSVTGHLILTTLHANTSPGAVKRLLEIGIVPFLVNAALAGVVSQRLVRVLCPACKQEAKPALHSIPPAAVEFVEKRPGAAFFAPIREKGCEACKGMGYRGRTAIHEILIPDDRVRQAVAAEADISAIRNAALAAGMRPMLLCGLEKAARGITSIEEVCRAVPHGPNE